MAAIASLCRKCTLMILHLPSAFWLQAFALPAHGKKPRVKPLTGVEHTILARYAAYNEIIEYNSQMLEYKKSHFEY